MRYIGLKRAAEECIEAINDFVNGDKYEGVDAGQFMREIRDILRSGLKKEEERYQRGRH